MNWIVLQTRLCDLIPTLSFALVIAVCGLWPVGLVSLSSVVLLYLALIPLLILSCFLHTTHPQSSGNGTNRPTVIADLMKAKRESLYPEIRRPAREIWIEPSLNDIRTFISQHIARCRLLSVDIETSGQRITCIGFAPSREIAIVIPF